MGDPSQQLTGSADETGLVIRPASRETFRLNLWLLCKDLPADDRDAQVQRLLDHLRKSPPGTAGILQAQRGSEVVGAILWTMYPGRTAVISAPGLRENEPLSTAEKLFSGIISNLRSSQTRLIFANLSGNQTAFHEPLKNAGFSPLARLRYLLSPARDFPRELPASDLSFVPVTSWDAKEFAEIVEETYIGTLDCPELNGIRETEDVLAGYRAAGVYSPDLWFVITHENEPVGCLVLTDHPDFDQLELVYMGLIPRFRGHGWGREAVRYAQWMARIRKRSGLLLAVDTRNTPAVHVYESLGMQPLEERDIFLFVFNDDRGATGPVTG